MAVTHVLVVESEPMLAARLKELFERTPGFCVETAAGVQDAFKETYAFKPDFVVIDLNTEFFSGFELTEVLRSRRSAGTKPVLVLRRRHEDDPARQHQVAIDKDVVRRKLSILFDVQRNYPQAWELEHYRDDRLTADFRAGRYEVEGMSVELTPREQMLLRLVVERRDRIVPRTEILTRLWGYETRSLDVYVRRLRTKLGVTIETLPGFGYRFSAQGLAHLGPEAVPAVVQKTPTKSRGFYRPETEPTRLDHNG